MEKKEVDSSEIHDQLLQTLDQHTNWNGRPLVKYNGFWLPVLYFRPILSTQKYFRAKDDDIILATVPKSGTTWLKALSFSIVNRDVYTIDQSPLLTCNPHMLVPLLELDLYFHQENPDLQHISSTPRIFSTHIPFKILPDSIRDNSNCRIIYICRNPLDQFISFHHFSLENKFQKDAVPLELDEAFDMFCQGIHSMGPFWDHMLGFWNAHLKNPEKVLFLKYEDLKEDITFYVKKIAEFLGCAFSVGEEKQGLIEQIAKLCSFESLKNLEVNKTGHVHGAVKNSSFLEKEKLEVGPIIRLGYG
ncbi:hypothetical protein DH2020_049353 [Rehmannia glutinosa]|uniref:Sulfotransferase n=1 Tax=Rehmannia glutinosa TaxID=99300 RepID=A0ABR0U3N1_REHGL